MKETPDKLPPSFYDFISRLQSDHKTFIEESMCFTERTHGCLLHTDTTSQWGAGLKELRERKASLDADSDSEPELLSHRALRRQSTPREVIEVATSRGNSPASVASQGNLDQHISAPRRGNEEAPVASAPVLSNGENGNIPGFCIYILADC